MGEKGNGALRRGSMEMADAENAMDFWADRIATCFNEPCGKADRLFSERQQEVTSNSELARQLWHSDFDNVNRGLQRASESFGSKARTCCERYSPVLQHIAAFQGIGELSEDPTGRELR